MTKRKKGQPVKKADDYPGKLEKFLKKYQFYPALTKKLDALTIPFDEKTINEIVLWKLARYVHLPEKLLNGLDGMRKLNPKEHRKAEKLLIHLLKEKGVQLAMASTFLRYANSKVFQIIDRHAYRAVYGKSFDSARMAAKEQKKQARLYFDYLDELHELCARKEFAFEHADRILYQFDKDENPPLLQKDSETLTTEIDQ